MTPHSSFNYSSFPNPHPAHINDPRYAKELPQGYAPNYYPPYPQQPGQPIYQAPQYMKPPLSQYQMPYYPPSYYPQGQSHQYPPQHPQYQQVPNPGYYAYEN